MSGIRSYSSSPSEQAMYGSWTSSMVDEPYEYQTSPPQYLPYPSSRAVFYDSPDTSSELDPGSSDGRTSYSRETEHSEAHVHPTNTAELHSRTEANQFTLLGSQHNPDNLGNVIFQHAATSSRIGTDKMEIASEFHHRLKSLAANLKQCRHRYQLSGGILENRVRLEAYTEQGESLYMRVQDLLSMSEENVRPFPLHADGTLSQEAWDTFTKSFLSDDHQLQEVRDLTRDMNLWVEYYKHDCVLKPFVFLGRDLDTPEFNLSLVACANYMYGPDSRIARPLREFCQELTKVAQKLDDIRDHEPLCDRSEEVSRRQLEARATMDEFIAASESLDARVRDLVVDCEAGVPEPYRCADGSISHDACFRFTRAMVRQEPNLEELKKITWDMRDWWDSYHSKCAPALRRLREEAETRQRHHGGQAKQHSWP